MKRDFLEGMSRVASTVCVITTDGPAGRRGVTVSAMTSVSADSDSPSLLIAVHSKSPTADAIRANKIFCVNLLRDSQSAISDAFAGRTDLSGEEKFHCTEWVAMARGTPAVRDALVAFECAVTREFIYGTHWVFIGELTDVSLAHHSDPLIYANRSYRSSVPLRMKSAPDREGSAMLRIGCLTALAPFVVGPMAAAINDGMPDVCLDVVEGEQSILLSDLRSDRIDLAVTLKVGMDERIRSTTLARFDPYVLLPEGHVLADGKALTAADLGGHPMILFDHITAPAIESWFESAGQRANIRYRAASFESVRSLVANGLGLSVLWLSPKSKVSYDGRPLVQVPIEAGPASLEVVAAVASERSSTKLVVEQLRHCFRTSGASGKPSLTAA